MGFTEGNKSSIQATCARMVKELQDNTAQVMQMYKENPTFPADFYNLSLRDADTKIQTVREVYKQITSEELK